MTRPLRNLISAVTLAALTGLLVLAATQWTDVFFRFYPAFSRWILGVLAGVTSVTSFPLWEPGLCLIVLWGVISLIRSLVRHHFLRWLSGLLLTLCGAAFFFMAVWGLNYFAPPMSERLGMETHGESLGLAMRDGISGDLTMNVGVASFENEALSLTFSVRYPVTLPYELVYPRLKRGFTLGGFTETEMTHAAALYIPKDSELIRRLLGVYEAETGEKAEPKCIGGGTYAKSMPNIVAFGPIFPGDEVREHKPDEYMETRRVMQNAEIIASAMKALAE